MTDTLLRKLSDKILEVYNLEHAEEFTNIFTDLTKEIKEDSYRYFNLVKKLAKCEGEKERQERIVNVYKEAFDVAKDVFDEERELREKIEKEKEQVEYDKEYFMNFVNEFLESRKEKIIDIYIDKEPSS